MRQGKLGAQGVPKPAAFFTWSVPAAPLSVQISLDIVDQIGAEVLKGFWAVPKRGAEIGGVLIGNLSGEEGSKSVVITDFELAPCEHRRGPSYVLSEPDRKRLEKALRKAGERGTVVGFFRSHTRQGLYLDQDNVAVIESYFQNRNQVMLLIRPQSSTKMTAGFFFWEETGIRRHATYLDFPFTRLELQERSVSVPAEAATGAEESDLIPQALVPIASPAPGLASTALAPACTFEAATQPVETGSRRVGPSALTELRGEFKNWFQQVRSERLDWRTVSGAGLGFLCVVLLEFQIAGAFQHPKAPPNVLPELSVTRSTDFLELRWNHSAAARINADHAVLLIHDGALVFQRELTRQMLESGKVSYEAASRDVSFRLELVGPHVSIAESIEAISAPKESASIEVKPAAITAAAAVPPETIRPVLQPVDVAPKPQPQPEAQKVQFAKPARQAAQTPVLQAAAPAPQPQKPMHTHNSYSGPQRGWADDGL